MELRRGLMAQMASGKLPAFFNHLLSGSFVVDSGQSSIIIQVGGISDPKGILLFSDEPFDLMSAKAEKPMLGAYGASYIRGSEEPARLGVRQTINDEAYYFVNWGSSGSDKFPAARASRTENRGLRYYNTETCAIEMNGFGSGDYDFKQGVKYNWIVWD